MISHGCGNITTDFLCPCDDCRNAVGCLCFQMHEAAKQMRRDRPIGIDLSGYDYSRPTVTLRMALAWAAIIAMGVVLLLWVS